MERLSIDAALAHHPTQGDVMAAAGPSPPGIGRANWPPQFDEVHSTLSHRGGLGNLSLLLRWEVPLDTIALRDGGGGSSSGSGGGGGDGDSGASAERALLAMSRQLAATQQLLTQTQQQLTQTQQQLADADQQLVDAYLGM